jgi:hypothetical protein
MSASGQRAVALSLMGWIALAGCVESRPAPLTRTYLVSLVDTCPGTSIEGFNLDGRVSTGSTMACNDAEDATSRGGVPGIDYHLGGICSLEPTLEERLAFVLDQIATGEYLLLLEVSDIDSFGDDASVDVRMFLGRAEGAVLLEDGIAVPGQRFVQRGDVLANVEGAIMAGTLTFESPSFPVTFTGTVRPLTFTLLDARVRAHITDGMLAEGEVGGRVTVAELVAFGEKGVTEEAIRELRLADLDPDPEDDTVCRAISAGFGFAAVLANPEEE